VAEEREETMHGSSPAPLLATLLERLQGRETLVLEVKSARHGLPQSPWSTVSAFANTQGGWIVLGVEEQNDSLVVTGVTQAHSLLQNLHTAMRNPQKISYEICGPNDISVEEIADKQVVVLRIPAAARKVRPLYS